MIENIADIPVDVPLLPYRLLKAGDLTCMYEAGNLRYITCGDIEVIRMIYGAVRDSQWETILPVIADESIIEDEKGVSIQYTAMYSANEIQYKARFEINLLKDNSITYSMMGTAFNSFSKNRIGICVLHPLSTAKGKQVSIIKPDGNKYISVFPETIAPHQPFKDIRQMQWQPAPQVDAHIYFEGDVFETEDQRNWSDSSYKTYSTPLEMPHPAIVHTGDTMQQRVIVKITGDTKQKESKGTAEATPSNPNRFSTIGLLQSDVSLKEALHGAGQKPVHHLRSELQLFESNWQEELMQSASTAEKMSAKLELIVFFTNDYDRLLPLFVQSIKPVSQFIYSILLLDRSFEATPPILMSKGYQMIKNGYPFIQVGYGTDGYFVSLNRNRPEKLIFDFVSCRIMPQAHASDTRTIIENLECLPDIIRTARTFTDKAIHISPLSVAKIKTDVDFEKEGVFNSSTEMTHSFFAASWTAHAIGKLEDVQLISIPFYQIFFDV